MTEVRSYENTWLSKLSRKEMQHLAKSLFVEGYTPFSNKEIVEYILSVYKLVEIPGHNNLSFKVFIGDLDVVVFELDRDGRYTFHDFAIPTLTIEDYDNVSYDKNIIIIKRKNNVFVINNYITKI